MICLWVSVTMTSVCQWHNCKCVYVSVCVCVCVVFQLLSFKLSSGYLFIPHHVNQGVVQKPTHKSLFTNPTLLKSLSGDAEVAGTARCCLTMWPKWGNSCTYCFHYIRGSVSRDTCCTFVQAFTSVSTLSTSTSMDVLPPKRSLKALGWCTDASWWKKVYLSIVYLTVRAFQFHCKKTVTLSLPRCGEVFVVTKTKRFCSRVK